MAQGSLIVLTAFPKGVFLEGTIEGTPSPGTVMQLDAAVEPVGGRFTWEVYDVDVDGDQRIIACLYEDVLTGQLVTTAYVDAARGYMYCPIMGERMNMLVRAAGTGTGDSLAIGDLLMVDDGTGMLVASAGTPESEPFVVMETVTDVVTGGTLVDVMYTGY